MIIFVNKKYFHVLIASLYIHILKLYFIIICKLHSSDMSNLEERLKEQQL